MNLSRKKHIGLVVLTACLLSGAIWQSYGAAKPAMENEAEGIIRFHVVASSNSEEDQSLKLAVRDGLLEEINKILINELIKNDIAKNVDEYMVAMEVGAAREIIVNNLETIESAATEIVAENGFDYEVKATMGVRSIPERTYGTITFPQGNYEALNVVIGEGKGENWWCVLFPPLCLIDAETLGTETDENYRNTQDTEEYPNDEENALVLRSRTVELLENLEQKKEHQSKKNDAQAGKSW